MPADAPLKPYSATFAAGEADSVPTHPGRAGEECVAWWHELARLAGPIKSAPRSITQLAKKEPEAVLLVIGSPAYVSAMETDLVAARSALEDMEHLIIVSSRAPSATELSFNFVLSDAVLQPLVGGASVSLHARIARKIVTEARRYPLRASEIAARFERLRAAAPRIPRPNRTPISDEEVVRFVKKLKAKEAVTTYTRALRSLRSQGLACEQKRFRALFLGDNHVEH